MTILRSVYATLRQPSTYLLTSTLTWWLWLCVLEDLPPVRWACHKTPWMHTHHRRRLHHQPRGRLHHLAPPPQPRLSQRLVQACFRNICMHTSSLSGRCV